MAVSAAERRFLLTQVAGMALNEIDDLWRQADRLSDLEFQNLVVDIFPDLLDPYISMAAELAATWFELSDPGSSYIAKTAEQPPVDKLISSAKWALYAPTGRRTNDLGETELISPTREEAKNRLTGSGQKAVFNGARETTLTNIVQTESRWVRHARPTACAFCKMLATRTTDTDSFYTSEDAALTVVGTGKEMSLSDRRARARGESRGSGGRFLAGGRKSRGTRQIGDKYHDDCYCIAVEVRDGQSYTPPDYVEKWQDDYLKARANAGTGDLKSILSAWRQIDNTAATDILG